MRKRQRLIPILIGALAVLAASLPEPVAAQTPYFPYYGKNRIRYDKFEWLVYKTDHFDIYFYPQIEPHLQRITEFAESAYQYISAELKHDLADRVPMVLFKTQSEFQTNNIAGMEMPEGVLAFAEPERNRMVLPIDEPPDQLYRLITHELTHIFEFAIIPRGIMGSAAPLWVDEGLANYMAGYWNVLDLMQIRDAALTDNIPPMSRFEAAPLSGRLPYSMGHAAFEFIEEKWGKEGLRQFLFALRKSILSPGDAYREALKIDGEDFDDQFDRYMKERFKPFRDKERPADYGRNIVPNRDRTHYVSVLTIEPSPSGEMMAVVVGNRRDQELDIILLSARNGTPILNVTEGFDKDRGFEYIATSGGLRGNLVPWISWAPTGDTIAYFARTEKHKTLIVHDIVNNRIVQRVPLKELDGPESPSFSPDGRRVAFSALSGAVGDIYIVDLDSRELTNVTKDAFTEYAPAFSPDGKTLVYTTRVGGSDKLFKIDLASRTKTQLTFGAHDDTAARFIDDKTIVFTSTALDPKTPATPAIARNANIANVWTLDLTTGELRQWTDTLSGNVSPVPVRGGSVLRIAFVSYYKGENGIHIITPDNPIAVASSSDFGSPGPIIDFQPPLTHTVLKDNIHKKGAFEKLSLAGRPPVGLGITSGGNFYGNTQLTFTDVMADKQISFYAQSVNQYRTTAFTYLDTERRIQYALQGFLQSSFYYGNNPALYDPSLAPYIDRDDALAEQSQKGATAYGIYPFNRYSRMEVFGGYMYLSENYNDPELQRYSNLYQIDQYGSPVFRRGHMMPVGVAFVQETTIFREFGPVAGNTMRLAYEAAVPAGGSWLQRQTIDGDVRHYTRLVANGVLALRLRGFKSWGRNPDFLYFGGNSEMRGYDYLSFLGHKGFFANAELRFPLIEAMLTPIGVLGGLRGVMFINVGGSGFNNTEMRFMARKTELYRPIIAYRVVDFFGTVEPVYGPEIAINGMRLVDGRASYGIGLESSLLGFPMHFDWAWKTLFNRGWEDALFAANAWYEDPSGFMTGSDWFRQMRFQFWIGYDW
jgi:WD40 repeat protein